MALALAAAVRDARATQILAALDAGAGPGKLRIYDGVRPATGGAPTTLLAEFTLADPAGTVTGAVLTLSAVADVQALATGTATWVRLVDSAASFVADLDVGAVGSGADMELDDLTLTAGQTIQITSFTITEPNA